MSGLSSRWCQKGEQSVSPIQPALWLPPHLTANHFQVDYGKMMPGTLRGGILPHLQIGQTLNEVFVHRNNGSVVFSHQLHAW